MPRITRRGVGVYHKPLHHYSREELDAFKRGNRDIKWALRDVAPYFRARDTRAFRHWVFTAGWIACLDYYDELLQEMARSIAGAANKAGEQALLRWETRTRLGVEESVE